MARRVFEAVALGVLEFCVVWMNPLRDLRGRMKVVGVEHFRAAMAQGRGVVLLGAHFGCLDIISQALADLGRIDVMYRYNKNPVLEWVQLRGRRHYYRGVIERQDTRAVLQALKSGRLFSMRLIRIMGRSILCLRRFLGLRRLRLRRRLGLPG